MTDPGETDALVAPEGLDALLASIAVVDDGDGLPPGDDLAALADWWRARQPDTPVRSAWLDLPAGGFDSGVSAARAALAQGATILVPRCPGDHAARAVIALLTRREASAVVHQPAGMTDREWVAACVAVRDAAVPLADVRADPLGMVDRLGADGLAAAAGALLAAAAARTPCLLDGTGTLAAALVADRLSFRARGWWLPASDSPDPARSAAVERLGLTPALRLRTQDEDGRAARACLALLAIDAPA